MMRKIGLILFLMIWTLCVYAKNATTPAQSKNTHIVLTCNKAAKDTAPNTVSMDTTQIALINRFLNDKVPYYKVDSILQSNLNSLQRELVTFQGWMENGEYCDTKLWVRIMLFSLAFLLIAGVLYVIIRLRGLRDEIVDVVKGSGRIKEWVHDNIGKPSTSMISKPYENEIRCLQNENRDLKNRVAALEDALNRKNEATTETVSSSVSQQSSSRPVEAQKLLYADSIIDGVFSHVWEKENDDTVFVLKLKDDNNASIAIFKRAYGKVIANASYLEGCEKQVIGNSSVEIVREGEAERGFNGKWRVVSPLKVEIQ